MALVILVSLLFGLLHLLAGVCVGEVVGDDPIDLQTRIYINPYPIAKWTDNKVIIALSQKAQCMSYTDIDETPLQSLASCELHCFLNGSYNTWDVSTLLNDEHHTSTFIEESVTGFVGLGISTLTITRAVHRTRTWPEHPRLEQHLHGRTAFPVESRQLQMLELVKSHSVRVRRHWLRWLLPSQFSQQASSQSRQPTSPRPSNLQLPRDSGRPFINGASAKLELLADRIFECTLDVGSHWPFWGHEQRRQQRGPASP